MMRRAWIVMVLCVLGLAGSRAQDKGGKDVSFKDSIFPVIKSRCLPCHAEDNFNPSDLSLDSYEDLMQGGKNGVTVVPGKAAESLLMKKLGEKPPFGDRMPLNKKEVIKEGKAKYLSEDEMKKIAEWINQGAKNN
ncbi:MAG TPA: c-type cytochrome domain-containing protein [Bacteroidota bacterium]|nr:c-type cytochrome domain-containing protein [Bacteroidota bacterium]